MIHIKQLDILLKQILEDKMISYYNYNKSGNFITIQNNTILIFSDYVRIADLMKITECNKSYSRYKDELGTLLEDLPDTNLVNIIFTYKKKYNREISNISNGEISWNLSKCSDEEIRLLIGIDEEMKEPIIQFKHLGFETLFSCIGHSTPTELSQLNIQLKFSRELETSLIQLMIKELDFEFNKRYLLYGEEVLKVYEIINIDITGNTANQRKEKLIDLIHKLQQQIITKKTHLFM